MLAGQHISQLVARDALHIRRFVAGIQRALQLGVGRLLGGYLLRQVLQLLALGNDVDLRKYKRHTQIDANANKPYAYRKGRKAFFLFALSLCHKPFSSPAGAFCSVAARGCSIHKRVHFPQCHFELYNTRPLFCNLFFLAARLFFTRPALCAVRTR